MTLSHKTPSSPCIGYCSTSLGDVVCKGCGRTAEEVDKWLLLDEEQTRLIWERVNGMDTIRNRPKWVKYSRKLLYREPGSETGGRSGRIYKMQGLDLDGNTDGTVK